MAVPPPVPRWLIWAALPCLLWYAFFLGRHFAPVAAGADSSGYMHSGRLLAAGRLTTPMRTIPELAVSRALHTTPLGFLSHESPDRLEPTYPVGLPLHLAAAYLVFGPERGTLFVVVGSAVAGLVLFFLLARELGVSDLLAAAGAVALGFFPIYLFTSFLPLSDTVATAWSITAYLSALRTRRAWGWSVLCGVACGCAVLVRPSCLIGFLPLPLILWGGRNFLGAALGGLPFGLWQLFYQRHLYGAALESGYGPIFSAFQWECFRPSMANVLTWLPRLLPVSWLAFLLAPWLPWRERGRELAALYLWFLALLFFYAYYDISQQAWWYLRFLLPGIPALVVLALVGLDRLITRRAGRWAWAFTLVAAGAVAWDPRTVFRRWEPEIHVMLLKPYQQLYLDVPAWTRAHCPPGSAIACLTLSGSIYYYTDFAVLRWDQFEAPQFARYAAALRASGRPLFAALLRDEVPGALHERMPGHWEKITEIDICTLWRYIPAP